MRVAVVEYQHYHDEVLPTIVWCLNRLGIEPDVYLPARAVRNQTFANMPELRYRLRVIDGLGRLRGTPSRFARYDALVVNTVEPETLLETVRRIPLPTLAVLHNADLITSEPYRRFFEPGSRHPLFLARHVAQHASPAMVDSWVAPVYQGPERRAGDDDGTTRFCVQGNVQFERRDYLSLVPAVAELASVRADFSVRIVGRSDTPAGDELRRAIKGHGVKDLFTFTSGEVSHPEFRALLAGADFMLPLLDPSIDHLSTYFRTKITMSMSMAIGLGLIPVAHARVAELYGVEDCAVMYQGDGLLGGMRDALGLNGDARATALATLGASRSAMLEQSLTNLATVLSKVGA